MYKSIEHRAVTNEKITRMSVATFAIPDDGVEIGPVDSVVRTYHQPVSTKRSSMLTTLDTLCQGEWMERLTQNFSKLENCET